MINQRINKLLTQQAVCSIRQADILIKKKKVTVNSNRRKIGIKINSENNFMRLIRKIVYRKSISKLSFVNKLKNEIISSSDNHSHKNILDLLHPEYEKGFYLIGRLIEGFNFDYI